MAGRPTIVAKLAKDAVIKHPQAATRALVRMLRTHHPEVFTNDNQARCAIRYCRGAMGEKHRKQATKPRSAEDAAQCKKWGALIPDPEPTEWAWQELPDGVERWLILGDVHLPYHDKDALQAALEHADGNCDGVLLLGDLVDAYQLSSFCRDPRKRQFPGEIDAVKRFFDALMHLNPKAVVWKSGNHEVRLERYLMQRAPELWSMMADSFSFRTICDLDDRGIVWIRPQDPIRHHQLALLHGHEWGNRFSSPVNPARGAFLKAHDCVIQGHEHRTSDHAETTLTGTTISCWSVGCLCTLHPEYRPLGNKWNHGFAYLNTGSRWSVENKRIINGEVL